MKHTIITIGPIYKTVHSVKSAKAIWAASYMFSYLIKQLIIKANLNADDMILPYFEGKDLNDKNQVGLFPDRLMIKKEISNIGDLINTVIKEFTQNVENDFSKKNIKASDVELFLTDYIRFSYIIVEPEESNLIFEFTKYLDTIELQNIPVRSADEDVVIKFLENVYYNFLVETEFTTNKRFPSTIEIAMAEYKEKNEIKYKSAVNEIFKYERKEDAADNQQRFIDKLYGHSELTQFKRNYQKYVAVVQADGDNMGKLISKLYGMDKGENLVSEFSKNLLGFSKESVELIKKYNGTPIYAGGDDLLFICPVAHTGLSEPANSNTERREVIIKESVLTLIDKIDKVFDKYFTNHKTFKDIIKGLDKKPSMSYGFSISYYKYPLNQALEQGAYQLFGKAKSTCKKNAVSFALLKHSGHFIGTFFHKDLKSYELFVKLISKPIKSENYISSIAYKLEPLDAVIFGIVSETDEAKQSNMFDNFFFNNFNESEHIKYVNGKKKLIDILEMTKELLKAVYKENPVINEADEKAESDKEKLKEKRKSIHAENLNKVYASLRFINFLNNKEER